ncbi:YhgE/Pip family protein [Bacillus sp. S14(2024)]|uniref:YhgE/Pip family protein n=1 Tax=Bacillus sp. S14(2024) TaxID=3162884 RepID=UPI003D210A4B
MRGFKLLGKEFATIIKSKKILIPIIAVLFIPVLYAGMFLWAFWDPYGQLKDLPVAVVNLDEGAVYNGKPIEAGKELVDNLKENKSFKWEFVSEKKAKEGMDDRKYYMTIRIPKDFSKNTTTLLDANPKKSKLEYIPNESLNFLSSQIGGSAIEKIKGEVANSVTKTYAETMFDSLKDVSKGFADASEGAGKLHDGTNQLKDGSQQITDGLGELSKKANDGLNQLSTGSNQITNGLGELNSKVSDMPSGVNQLLGGSQQITKGLGELNSKVSGMPEKANQLLDGSQKITNGLNQFNDPQGKYQSGLKAAQKGAQDISSGASRLSQGVSEWKKQADKLSTGANTTAGGAKAVADGLAALNGKLKDLPEEDKQQLQQLIAMSQKVAAGTSEVAQGAQGLAGEKGAGQIEAGATQLASGAGQLNDGINQLSKESIAGLNQLADGSGKVTAGVNELASQSGPLASGVSALLDGSGKVTSGLNTLADSAGPLASGVSALLDGSQKISGGLGQFVDPKGDFQSGLTRLQDGSGQVTSGLGEANDGSKELATKLGEGAEKTSETKGTNKTYDMFSSPVKVKTEKTAEVPNYGTGFTPYFLSLGLFVGALLLSIVFPLRETVGMPKSGFSWFISKFGVLLAVGVIQALVADAVLLLGLGVEVQSVPYFVLFSIITSLTFIALVQFLVTALSDAGRFVAILTLILQLTTSAGTFPLELIPKPLQVFNAWFPMTYSVSGFKAVISSGDYSFMWHNAGILMTFIVLLSLGTIGTLTWMHKRQFGKFAEAE